MNTRIRIKPKTISLNRDDVRELLNIIKKIPIDDSKKRFNLDIQGGNEKVFSGKIDEFLNAKWPANIDEIRFRAYSYDTSDEIELWFDNDLFGTRRIDITSNDLDWVAARTKELEDFINDHRNFHWIFNFPFVWVVWLITVVPLITLMVSIFDLEAVSSTAFGGGLGWLLYLILQPVAHIFPFVNIDSNRPSTRKLLRKFLCWIIPALFVALLCSLIYAIISDIIS